MLEPSARPQVLSIVLAGGEGKRLAPLTLDRAKPAVPFGGHYRLIDFALSNLANGGYRKIVVLTQYKSHSLDVHVSRTWRLSTFLGNYVTSVPAQMRRGKHWFQGSADAIYQNLNLIEDEKPRYIFVFGADHIYRMDPRQMLDQHIESGAGVTVAGIRVPRDEAWQFGCIKRGAGTNMEAFLEKPEDPPGLPDSPDETLISMGNYVFDTEVLVDVLEEEAADEKSGSDIGGDIIPRLVDDGLAHVYDFTNNVVPGDDEHVRGYWRDVGTIDSFFDAHMDLVQPLPNFSLYNDDWPIWTLGRSMPPAKFVRDGDMAPHVENSVVCNGAIVSGADVRASVISPGARIGAGAVLDQAVIMDNVEVGAGAVLRRCIVDKNTVIPPGTQIGVDAASDRSRFTVSEGGVVAIAKNHKFSDTAAS